MKKFIIALSLIASIALAVSYTDLDEQDGKGPSGQSAVTKINANFAVLETLMQLTPGTTVTNGGSIATTSTYLQATPSNVATCTVAAAQSAGQILIIENVGTNALTIADNAQVMALGSDAVLGTDDTLTLIANTTTNWSKLATSNN